MSIVTPLSVFFALNPDEELTARDIGDKWGVEPNNVGNTLRYAEAKGWVSSTMKPNPRMPSKKIKFYAAGPRLRQEIGL